MLESMAPRRPNRLRLRFIRMQSFRPVAQMLRRMVKIEDHRIGPREVQSQPVLDSRDDQEFQAGLGPAPRERHQPRANGGTIRACVPERDGKIPLDSKISNVI